MRFRALPVAAWLSTFGIAVYLRVNNLRAAIVGDEIAANGPDSAYHVRRMLSTWAHYPDVPNFDPLLNWPHGAVAPWPPGYDLLVASMALIASDRFWALFIISMSPVVLGLILIALVGIGTRSIAPRFPWWTAWLAASLVAFFPQAVSVARFGNPDHHIVEALIMLLLGLWALSVWRALSEGELSFWARIELEGLGAGVAGFSGASFVGSPAYVAIAGAVLVVANWRWGRGVQRRWGVGAPGLLVGALITMVCYRPVIAADHELWSYEYPSYFQPLLIAVAGIGCTLASAAGALLADPLRRRVRVMGIGAALVLVGVGVLVLRKGALWELLHGLDEWFLDSETPLARLSENQPLFSRLSPQSTQFARAYRYYGAFGPLMPLLVAGGLGAYLHAHGGRRAFPFLFWSVCIFGLMLHQNRFGRVGLVNLAICTAFAVTALAEHAMRLRGVLASVPQLALLLDPAFHYYLVPLPAGPLPDMQEAGVYLREHTPRPLPGKRAGVLAPWDSAHFIVRYGERPVTANGFAIYVARDALDELHEIWADDESRMLRFASARDLGFVAVSAATFTTRTLHGLGPLLPAEKGAIRLNTDYFARVPLASLLFGGSGIADAGVPHVAHLLPRFASSFPGEDLPMFVPGAWIYEIVDGATVAGSAPAGSIVRLQTPMRLRGRGLVHEAWTRARPDGGFSLTTALPTGYRGHAFETARFATLRVGADPPREIAISEDSVRRGQSVSIGLAAVDR